MTSNNRVSGYSIHPNTKPDHLKFCLLLENVTSMNLARQFSLPEFNLEFYKSTIHLRIRPGASSIDS